MTKLVFFKSGEKYIGFRCSGHSGYSESGGDIVCAAVSTAIQFVSAYLLEYYGDVIIFHADEDKGIIELKCKCSFGEADRHLYILECFAKQLHEQYTDYFDFDFMEV